MHALSLALLDRARAKCLERVCLIRERFAGQSLNKWGLRHRYTAAISFAASPDRVEGLSGRIACARIG
jgi:hypothetical protein